MTKLHFIFRETTQVCVRLFRTFFVCTGFHNTIANMPALPKVHYYMASFNCVAKQGQTSADHSLKIGGKVIWLPFDILFLSFWGREGSRP
jgi:hypothetical protein